MKNNNDVDRGQSSFGLTPSGRGWYKRIPGAGVKWIASFSAAPTARDADLVFAKKFADLSAPTPKIIAVDLEYAVNSFIDGKRGSVHNLTLSDYIVVLRHFVEKMGGSKLIRAIGPTEFTAYAKRVEHYSVARRIKIVGVVRTAFNWWIEQQWIDAVHYGPVFVQPNRKQRRIDKADKGKRLYTAKNIRQLYRRADTMMRAAVLLGINGGLGPTDIATVRADMITGGTLNASRSKTGGYRVVPLWPSTLRALARLTPNKDGLLFHGSRGGPIESDNHRGIGRRFKRLCEDANVPNLGFYTLRRTFRTVADNMPDRRAIEVVMGHVSQDMGAAYVQEINLDRVRAITDYVLRWFAGPAASVSALTTRPPQQTGGVPATRRGRV